jgi:alpha-beta hydrolase superfamily lysophospholipase
MSRHERRRTMEPDFTRVFIHGLESSSGGTKGNFFRKRYPDMIIEDYRGTLDQRMTRLRTILHGRSDLLLVGSSYGGLMAAIYAFEHSQEVSRLVLLAPALSLDEFGAYLDRSLDIPVIVYHGTRDDVVPSNPVRKIASKVFTNLEYNMIDDNHPLEAQFKTLDWNSLLCYE